jgi:hypothetical protein
MVKNNNNNNNPEKNLTRRKFINRITQFGILGIAGGYLIADISQGTPTNNPVQDPPNQVMNPVEPEPVPACTCVCTCTCECSCDCSCGCNCSNCVCSCTCVNQRHASSSMDYCKQININHADFNTNHTSTGGAQTSGTFEPEFNSLEMQHWQVTAYRNGDHLYQT